MSKDFQPFIMATPILKQENVKKGTSWGLYDIIEIPSSVGEGKESKCLCVTLQMHFSIISVCFTV